MALLSGLLTGLIGGVVAFDASQHAALRDSTIVVPSIAAALAQSLALGSPSAAFDDPVPASALFAAAAEAAALSGEAEAASSLGELSLATSGGSLVRLSDLFASDGGSVPFDAVRNARVDALGFALVLSMHHRRELAVTSASVLWSGQDLAAEDVLESLSMRIDVFAAPTFSVGAVDARIRGPALLLQLVIVPADRSVDVGVGGLLGLTSATLEVGSFPVIVEVRPNESMVASVDAVTETVEVAAGISAVGLHFGVVEPAALADGSFDIAGDLRMGPVGRLNVSSLLSGLVAGTLKMRATAGEQASPPSAFELASPFPSSNTSGAGGLDEGWLDAARATASGDLTLDVAGLISSDLASLLIDRSMAALFAPGGPLDTSTSGAVEKAIHPMLGMVGPSFGMTGATVADVSTEPLSGPDASVGSCSARDAGSGMPSVPAVDGGTTSSDRYEVRGSALCEARPGRSDPGSPFEYIGLISLAILASRRWKRSVFPLLLVTISIDTKAEAQDEFSMELFAPSVSSEDALAVNRPIAPGHLSLGAAVAASYANDPLVVIRLGESGGQQVAAVIEHQLVTQLTGSLGLGRRGLVFLRLPVHPYARGADVSSLPVALASTDSPAVGDVSIGGRFVLLRTSGDLFALAAQGQLFFPTSRGSPYAGEETVTGHPRLLAEIATKWIRWSVDVGALIRRRGHLGNDELGSALTFASALTVPVRVSLAELDLGVELYGNSAFTAFGETRATPIELLGTVRTRSKRGFDASIGAGSGIRAGYGAADLRLVAAVGYHAVIERDADHDGVVGEDDRCPVDAEDGDGFEDHDGCPDLDDDGDGIPDVDDLCPGQPEDRDGIADSDGCPEEDFDEDGVLDAEDECPLEPEDLDGVADSDGCPDEDSDEDGISDADDECPLEPEDRDGIADSDGCPEEDFDEDGVSDVEDECPLDPEPIEGTRNRDGCPDRVRVDLVGGLIRILEPVHFGFNSDEIRERSHRMLREMAGVLKRRAELGTISIEGHTDDRGADSYNLALSSRRAESVRLFLIREGVAATRLVSSGFGETRPVDPRRSSVARSRNRRVEFRLVDSEVIGTTEARSADANTPTREHP